MDDKNQKFLFILADSTKRPVYVLKDSGILHIESNFGKDDFKKEYNLFVDDYRYAPSILTYLRDMYHKVQANLYRKNITVFHRILNKFIPYVPHIYTYGNFLDVGCNTGSLLSKLPADWTKFGVEISTEAYKVAIKNHNMKVYNSSVENFNPDCKFKFVRASHVIEHILDYDAFLKKIYSIMDSESYALLYTPNTKSVSYLLFKKYWNPLYETTHVNLFNLDNIDKICRKQGFEVLEKGTYYMGTTAGSVVCFLGLNIRSRLGQAVFFSLFCMFYPFSYFINALNLGGALYIYIKKQQSK